MLISRLRKIVAENKDRRMAFLRSLLKEAIEYYTLNFVFISKWGKHLLFKGGTCLRFCFGLPRLSEDLDFDVEKAHDFNVGKFTKDLERYYFGRLQYKGLITKIANNKRTVYLKFPILDEIGLSVSPGDSNVVHVRIDFAEGAKAKYTPEISGKSYSDLTFAIRRYSKEDLFAGKISAILTREKMEGTVKVARVKARDCFDFVWFAESGIKPNWANIKTGTGFSKSQILERLNDKFKKVTRQMIIDDLAPFIEDLHSVESFADNFQMLAKEALIRIK